MGGEDHLPEKSKSMADVPPPPPPPASPLHTPTTLLAARAGGAGDEGAALSPPEGEPGGLLSPPLLLEIEEGTPAAEALKANADVRVSKLLKAGRSTRLQAGVRGLKSAARTASGRPGHTSDRRGDPAFVVPHGGSTTSGGPVPSQQQPPTIPEVEDEGGDEGEGGPDRGDSGGGSSAEAGAVAEGHIQGAREESASLQADDDKLAPLDDSSTDRNEDAPAWPHPPLHKYRSLPHITHAALPAAIAAACRAGEDMDRQRAGLHERDGTEGEAAEAGRATLMTHLFKPAERRAGANDVPAVSPVRHRLSAFQGKAHGRPLPLYRRSTQESGDRPSLDAHSMPSEISVAETEKCANHRPHDTEQLLEDLSDDGGSLAADDPATREAMPHIQVKKVLQVDPIVVEIPGSSPLDAEGAEDAEDVEEGERADEDPETDERRSAFMTKAKKKMSMRGLLDDEAFHFQGPRSVRKWVKRRRSKAESKTPRSYVTGKVIDEKHDQYITSIAVMFGMRTSIGRTNLAMSQTPRNERRWLDNDDTMAVVKYEFPPRGSALTPPHQLQHTFKFKDYSPLAFAYLRRMFGVNEYDFLLSVCSNANYIAFQSNAKSGQFFFYSPDGKYMIKTMTNAESKFLRRILPHYFRHCAMNPNTLVTKFLGMYRVKLYHLRRNVKFVVMKSVYDTDKFLHQLFDLKGSSKGREARPGDAVKKDNDIRRMLPDGAFVMEPGLRERLRTQVEKDCAWLSSMKIMDYSMLVGVHNISLRTTKKPLRTVSERSAISSEDGDDRSNSSFGASASNATASMATLDRFLDVDDDNSYLDGARRSLSNEPSRTVRVVKSLENGDEESSKGSKKGSDFILEKAVEDMYWPFHRFYDIQGLRRMEPVSGSLLVHETKQEIQVEHRNQEEVDQTCFDTLCAPSHDPGVTSERQYDLKSFEKPLSYRKDGGFTMDTSNFDLPLKISKPGAPHVVEYYDGKIIYMGIIDILQQFNIRKRAEAHYRRAGTKGWEAASCVHPSLYADRFVRFFDEYTEGPE